MRHPSSATNERRLAAWLLAALVLAAPAAAQQVDPPAGTADETAEENGQSQPPEFLETVTVTASRVETPLQETAGAVTVVGSDVLEEMPKSVGAEEALKLVPGVTVDNQANGERVHLSIRGIGILTERGIRGVQVLLDGIPLNDPSGFAPDLFDVDWATVERVEVLRGPNAPLYGGGSAGGVLNIITRDGSAAPVSGGAEGWAGSYGFRKALAEVGGSSGDLNYRVSVSRNRGDGYRVHTAFDSDNVYGKVRWTPAPAFQLAWIGSWTDFFNQNAEGLNLAQVD